MSFQSARIALASLGYIPLVAIGCAEHWVKDNSRCILYIEGKVSDCVCEKTELTGHKYSPINFEID